MLKEAEKWQFLPMTKVKGFLAILL